MKKILAIMMAALMLAGLLAGCGDTTPEATNGAGGEVNTPVAAGMLVLNAAAALNISYDADGLVLNVEGINEGGENLAAEYTDYLGKSCSEAICDLIAASVTAGYLNEEVNYAMIKVAVGSAMPGATFMETIQKDAEGAIANAGSTAALVVLTEENLDDNGYIDLESAKVLVAAYLAVKSLDTIDGTPEPVNGMYNFRITAGDYADDLIVDGISGDVYQGVLEDVRFEEDVEETVDTADPTDEVFVDTQPATELPTEPPVDDPVDTEPVADVA